MGTWRKGDLGRFRQHRMMRPQFEVIRMTADRKTVEVLYEGRTSTEAIPMLTFRNDCLNWWELRGPVPKKPDWLQEGVDFEFGKSDPKAKQVIQGPVRLVNGRPLSVPETMSTPLANMSLTSGTFFKVRSIRLDYVSCSIPGGDGRLFLFPLWDLISQGFHRTTSWDRLDQDDLIETL